MDIDKLIAQGENQSLEFKSAQTNPESLAKEMVAFANSEGGVILFGVDDDGHVSGLTAGNKNYEEWVANIARQNVVPGLDVGLRMTQLEGKFVLVIDVPKGNDKPYQTHKNQFLIRIGSTNRTATQGELMRLFQQSGMFHFDLQPVERTSIRDLNFTKLDQYFSMYEIDFSQEDDKERLLRNTDILSPSGQATVGGLLIFGINPQRYLHNACISFAHFAGTELDEELLDKQVVTGSLDIQVDTALAIIKNHIRQPSRIEGAKTVDQVFQYPEKVFRELLVNACVHRDYSIHGSRIRVFMFDDRIEFMSPGRLPNTVSIEKIKQGVSFARNPVILKFMENLRYIDKLGRGLPMVYRTAKTAGKTVEFAEFGEEFKVVLGF
ncbi:MAG: putative DNA binding domain-containing protein [Thiolinea sp.]